MYRTPSFGGSKDYSNGGGGSYKDSDRSTGGQSYSASTSQLDRIQMTSSPPTSPSRESALPRKTSASTSHLGLSRRDNGTGTGGGGSSISSSGSGLERSSSYLSKYVPLSERGITLKSSGSNGGGGITTTKGYGVSLLGVSKQVVYMVISGFARWIIIWSTHSLVLMRCEICSMAANWHICYMFIRFAF